MSNDVTPSPLEGGSAAPTARREEKPWYTPGPWAWFGSTSSDFYLATTHSGRKYVMSFRRKGLQRAEPCFRKDNMMVKATDLAIFEVCREATTDKDPRVYRRDVIGFRSGDASLIAAAPEMYEALLAVNKLISEAAMTGFNCHDGDWADRLFHSQQATSKALRKARNQPRGSSAGEAPCAAAVSSNQSAAPPVQMEAVGQQLVARIKRSSKYYGQTKPNEWFDVLVCGDRSYRLRGNSNNYRISDVVFGIRLDGGEIVELK